MWEARSMNIDNTRKWVKYRTGLQIALLAGRPFRLQAFTDIEYLGEQPHHAKRPYILRCGNSWFIGCPDNTGLRKKFSPPARVHGELVPYMSEYMLDVRPKLRGDDGFGPLWASTRSQEAGANGIYKRIVHYTKIGFSIAVNPHLFRDCYATSMPEAHHALGNSRQITATVYDLSTTRDASSKINQSRGRFILDDDGARASIRGLQRKV